MSCLLCSSLQHPLEVGSVIPILHIRKLRLREVSSTRERELEGLLETQSKRKKETER